MIRRKASLSRGVFGLALCLLLSADSAAQVETPVWPLPPDVVLLRLPAPDTAEVWGSSVAGVGDIDGDGHGDLAVAVFDYPSSGLSHGRVDIVSGRDGSRLRSITTPDTDGQPMWTCITSLGDVTGDGRSDLALGLAMMSDCGHLYLVSPADGRIVHEWLGDNLRDFFGKVVATAGDLDRDGAMDIIASSGAGDDADEGLLAWLGFPERGNVRALSGRTGAVLWKTDEEDGMNQRWGTSLAGIGDQDGDGVADVVVGQTPAYVFSSKPTPPGCAWILSGSTGQRLRRIEGTADGDHFGAAVAGLGDVDGDGHGDVLVASDGTCPRNDLAHAGYVRCFGGPGDALLYELDGANRDGEFGHALTTLPDWDGDCRADWVASAPDAYGSSLPGLVRVHSGRTGRLVAVVSGECPGDEFGSTLADIGDADADGYPDLAVVARRSDRGRRPVLYVLSGRVLAERVITGCCDARDSLSPISK